MQKDKPTGEELEKARAVADKAVALHVALLGNKTPKVHVAQCHAVDQYLSVKPGLICLLIEHWVERNHQEGYQIKEMHKHMPELQRRANSEAGKRKKRHNPAIQQRIAEVNKSRKRIRPEEAAVAAAAPPQVDWPARFLEPCPITPPPPTRRQDGVGNGHQEASL